jgi:MFS family permease
MGTLSWKQTGRFFLSAFWMDFSGGMYIVALPFIAMSLGAGSLELGIIGAVRGIAYMFGSLVAATVAAMFGRRATVTASCLAVAVLLLLTAAVGALWQLCAVAAVWAVALALFWPSLLAWVGDSHGPAELGRATGTTSMGWSLGAMAAGLFAGWLYKVDPMLPILTAVLPVLLAAASVRRLATQRVVLAASQASGRSDPTARRRLVAAWIGNGSVFCLIGLMGDVFPRFGTEIGVTPFMFGALVTVQGLARTGVFGMGLLGAEWPRKWTVSVLLQLLAASAVALVGIIAARWWLVLAFAALGLSMGTAYYVSLYASLESAWSRGMNSGIHEATLMAGALLGALGGGAIAHVWGVRAPYLPLALLVLLLALAQVVLNVRPCRRVDTQPGSEGLSARNARVP